MRKILGMFDQGQKPTISCVNFATIALGVDFKKLIAAMQSYVNNCVAPIWGTPVELVTATTIKKKVWVMAFYDDADQAGALAYHDLTPDGWPLSKVFVRTTLDAGELVSVSASHELVEMLVDPAINMMTTGPSGTTMYAYESADPVEATSFPVAGIEMSNFVYPSYFEDFRTKGKFDYMSKIKKPFQLLPGGYQIIYKNGKWSNVFGSKEKEHDFQAEDRRGHRSEIRKSRGL